SSRFSKYCHSFLLYADPETDLEQFYTDIQHFLQTHKIDVLIPMGENISYWVNQKLKIFNEFTNILQPNLAIFRIARDKSKTLNVASDLNIPIPRHFTFEEVQDNNDKGIFPLLIKPRISSASMGMKIVYNYNEFIYQYNLISERYPNPIIQELIKQGGGHYQLNAILDFEIGRATCWDRE